MDLYDSGTIIYDYYRTIYTTFHLHKINVIFFLKFDLVKSRLVY